MKYQIFSIVFSIILVPVNIGCAFWLFQEALNLTGMTFKEFLETTSHVSPSVGRHRFSKRQRFFIKFFKEHSTEPQRSIRLLWAFGICTLPSLVALYLAEYAAIHVDKLKYAFIGNLILVVINMALVIWSKIYRNNPIKSIAVYVVVGAFFLGILFFLMTGISGISQPQQHLPSQQTAILNHSELIALLNEKGYETANIPTTYWEINESKLLNVAAGVKGDSKFEFYEYSDDETVDLVYNQIVYLTAPELENVERENYETTLSDGNRVFTILIDDVYYLVMYRNDTVVYAYSPDSLNEIKEILTGIGYLKN